MSRGLSLAVRGDVRFINMRESLAQFDRVSATRRGIESSQRRGLTAL